MYLFLGGKGEEGSLSLSFFVRITIRGGGKYSSVLGV